MVQFKNFMSSVVTYTKTPIKIFSVIQTIVLFCISVPKKYVPILTHGYYVPKTVYDSNEGRFFFGHFNCVGKSYVYENRNVSFDKGEVMLGWITFSRPYKNITIYISKHYILTNMK